MPTAIERRTVDWTALLIDAVNKPGLISSAYQLFWRYSVGNQILALFQCLIRKIEPGPIHTYRGWLKLGRQVRKGEKAIILVMPVQIKRRRHETPPEGALVETESSAGSCVNAGDVTFTKFIERPFWFVLSQTDGDPVQTDTAADWDEATALDVLSIERVPFNYTDGNCQGHASGRQVAVSPIAFMPHRTLFHEVAHVELGHTAESIGLIDHGETTPRDIREVEAECVALICSAALGLPGEEFSRGYIQHWLMSDTIPDRNVQRIFKAADTILRAGRPQEIPAEAEAPTV